MSPINLNDQVGLGSRFQSVDINLFLQIYSPDRMLMVHLLSDLLDLYSPAVLRIINPSIPGWLVFISTTRSEPFAFPILDPLGCLSWAVHFAFFVGFTAYQKHTSIAT